MITTLKHAARATAHGLWQAMIIYGATVAGQPPELPDKR